MPQVKEAPKMTGRVFRNPKNMIWYLQRRPNQPESAPNYLLGPNETVEALDDAEAMLLASMGLIDVAKESPAIANEMDGLRRQIEEERKKNAELTAQNKALTEKAATKKR